MKTDKSLKPLKFSLVYVVTVLLFALNLRAATLNLKIGESVTILPNQQTTVTCGFGGNIDPIDCRKEAAFFKKNMDLCVVDSPTQNCLNQHWSRFKSKTPQCVQEAFDMCFNFCNEFKNSSECVNYCN